MELTPSAMIESSLQSIGLDEKEIKVYLASLERGEQPASVIATHIHIPRNTARFVLDKLVEKGLIRRTVKGRAQLYCPEEPQSLVYLLEKQRVDENAKIDEEAQELGEVMAELETRYHPDQSKPKVTFYEGDEGLIKVYEDTLTSSEGLRSFASFETLHGILPDYFQTYFKRRAEKNIFMRSIHPDSPAAKESVKRDKEVFRETRLVPADFYNFSPEIQFYDGKVSITSLKEKLGIIIESREIYQAMVVAFELAWQEATRLDPRYGKGKVKVKA